MYRPFLPLMRLRNPSRAPDKQSYARAVACVNVARNIVHITLEMRKRSLLKGSHWFVMYTSYFSILTLLYLIFDNARSSMSADILKDAKAGREVLDDLARESLTAARCSQSLTVCGLDPTNTVMVANPFITGSVRGAASQIFWAEGPSANIIAKQKSKV